MNKLQDLWARGAEFLGCPHAIMGGAMSWVSERNLVSALSNAGAFGVIAASSMPPELLEQEIVETRKLLRPLARSVDRASLEPSSMGAQAGATGSNPNFGVNLIIMHPKLDELVQVCLRQKVSHVVLAGGIPSAATIKTLKDGGAKVICFAPAEVIARKLVKNGADALVIEGCEAGGHIGPVSTSVLAQEILPVIRDVPVFVAGGIGRGEMIASYLEMGAAGVQLGTRFVCATESIAHPNFKNAFIRAAARNAMPSVQVDPEFPVIPVRAIENAATEEFKHAQLNAIAKFKSGELDKKDAQLAIEHFWAGALRKAVIDGDVERGSLMAGQSVGMVTKIQPTQEIIDELVAQAAAYLGSGGGF